MSDKKTQKIEVSQKFLIADDAGSYGSSWTFETRDEAVEWAQKRTFKNGSDVLVYQAVEKATPNTKEVKVEKLT
jgi:hypothetical protein